MKLRFEPLIPESKKHWPHKDWFGPVENAVSKHPFSCNYGAESTYRTCGEIINYVKIKCFSSPKNER